MLKQGMEQTYSKRRSRLTNQLMVFLEQNLQKLKDHLIDVLSKMEKYKTSLASNVESISEVQKRTSDQLKEGVLLSERVEDYFREKMDSAIKNLKNTSRASVEERLRFINILLDEVGGGMITEYVLFVFLANDMNEDHIREEFNRFMKMMHKHEHDILESKAENRLFALGTPIATFSPAEGRNKMRRNRVLEQIEKWIEGANAKALEKRIQSLKNLRAQVQNLADEVQADLKSHS
eukprot:jgi/Bigna1/79613/fgenesh1_pg.63_\